MSTLPLHFAESPIGIVFPRIPRLARVNLCATPCTFFITCTTWSNTEFGPERQNLPSYEGESVAHCAGPNTVGPPCINAFIVGGAGHGAGENAHLVILCHARFV